MPDSKHYTFNPLTQLNFLNGDRERTQELQRELAQDGVYHGPPDGTINSAVIRALQQDLNKHSRIRIDEDGIAGPETIKSLQRELKRRGYYRGQIDGVALEETQTAVRTYFDTQFPQPSNPATTNSQSAKPTSRAPGQDILSEQAHQVSEVAAAKGDLNYLMVDKARGRVILFENGKPVFTRPALTGESLSDRLPTSAYHKSIDAHTPDEKVTPAGRYTVIKDRSTEYGDILRINELHGDDWTIALHRVYTGTPSEHRPERLSSGKPDQSHISFGCINVTPDTVDQLIRRLPNSDHFPIYILPQDQSLTADFFPRPHGAPKRDYAIGGPERAVRARPIPAPT